MFVIKKGEQIKEQNNSNWINVQDVLPEQNTQVLVYSESIASEGNSIDIGFCRKGCWFLKTENNVFTFPDVQKK